MDKEERAQKRREEEAELQTIFLTKGLNARNRKPHPEVTPDELSKQIGELQAAFNGKSLWELWCDGDMARWHIMQYLITNMDSKHTLAGVGRFLLRVANLHDGTAAAEVGSEQGSIKRVCAGLKSDTGADAQKAEDAIPNLHAATRRVKYEAPKFTVAFNPVLDLIPDIAVTSDEFLTSDIGKEFARAKVSISHPIGHDCFVKSMNLAVGGFGIVDIAWSPYWAKPYALKRQNMAMIIGKDHIEKLKIEWRVHRELRSPFVLDMLCSYMSDKDLVMALRYMSGGDLSFYIKDAKRKQSKVPSPNDEGHFGLDSLSQAGHGNLTHECDEKHAKQAICRFYLAATLLGLEALHAAGFVYRDLKDMNILLDAHGQARLADFGLCADVSQAPTTGSSGTKGYWAPEQLDESEYHHSPDFWTFGVCAYHWSTLKLPFPADIDEDVKVKKEQEGPIIKEKIKAGKYDRKRKAVARALKGVPELKSLLDGLLTLDPKQRLGCGGNGWSDVKCHAYWKDFPWETMQRGILTAPLMPTMTKMNAAPPSSLKEEFVDWAKQDAPANASETFAWWDFVNPELLEEMAIEAGDKDTAHFSRTAIDETPTPSKVTWADLCGYNAKKTLHQLLHGDGGSSGDGDDAGGDSDGGSGGGCCVLS